MAIAASPVIVPSATRVDEHTRRIVAWRLLPFLFILYIVNYVDRTNLAYAALGMSRELGFSDHVFGMGAGIFFISYLALQTSADLFEHRSQHSTNQRFKSMLVRPTFPARDV